MKASATLPAPDFSIQDAQGQTVNLAAFRGQRHVVLVFLRGFA